MHVKRIARSRSLRIGVSFVLVLAWGATPVLAGCNSSGCWSKTISMVRVKSDGRIWVVTNNSAELNNLAPADGCVLKAMWTGQVEPALYIPPADPDRDEKYTMLLTAYTTGSVIGFNPVKDPATGWCAIGDLDIK